MDRWGRGWEGWGWEGWWKEWGGEAVTTRIYRSAPVTMKNRKCKFGHLIGGGGTGAL